MSSVGRSLLTQAQYVPLYMCQSIFISLRFLLSPTACIQCALCDGVLAWRCYVIFDRRLWVKWALLFAIPCVCGMIVFSVLTRS
jgi:hypothetical protein